MAEEPFTPKPGGGGGGVGGEDSADDFRPATYNAYPPGEQEKLHCTRNLLGGTQRTQKGRLRKGYFTFAAVRN